MKKCGSALLLLGLLLWHGHAGAAVSASVDRTRIAISDSLQLSLQANAGEDLDAIDLSSLEQDFSLGASGRSSRFSINNGRTETSVELSITLYPRRTGALLIPSLTVDGAMTQPIAIQVLEAPQQIDRSEDVFVEAELDSERVYVQAQLLHTFRIYQAVQLDDRNRTELEIPDAIVEELDTQTFQRTVDGRTYQVIEVRHVIFPQKSGELTIPAMGFSGRERLSRGNFLSFGGRGELLRRRTRELKVEVLPIPASFPDAQWLPASRLTLEEDWSQSPDSLAVGDSATRTITLSAEGLNGQQLPALATADIEGLRMYPDQPRTESVTAATGITGLGINSTAVLVTAAGDYQLPARRIPWWDTRADVLRYAELPARRIRITEPPLPAAATGAAEAMTVGAVETVGQANEAGLSQRAWFWATLASLAGWALTTLWLLRRGRRPEAPPGKQEHATRPNTLFSETLAACKRNDAFAARARLLAWAQQHFEREQPLGIDDVAEQLQDSALAEQLQNLERCLFGSGQAWQGAALEAALRRWQRSAREAGKGSDQSALPPLYSGGVG